MKLFELFNSINETKILLEKLQSTNINLGDGFIMLGDHWNARQAERLSANQLLDFKSMLLKFSRDPIKSQVIEMEPDDRYSEFCLYNDENLGTSIAKKSIPHPTTKELHTIYMVTTVSPGLLFYSWQTLYRVPNEGPVRRFSQEDLKTLSNSQNKGLSKGGRLGR